MSRTDSLSSATLLRFPAAAASQTRFVSGATPSRADIERAIASGRRLQGEALRDGFRRLYHVLVGGCSLRSLRLPGELPGQRHSCC